jgi:hypothetical protein
MINGDYRKYLVIKREDMKKYLPIHYQTDFCDIIDYINERRTEDGKKHNLYIVINTDEPYAQEVIDIMKKYGHWG